MAKGHHQRVRTRANEQNIDTIPEYEVLEMIIHGVVKQKDVGAAARNLIEEFGSLANVIDAPAHDLCKVDGIGPASADFIKKIPYFFYKYRQSFWNAHKTFDNITNVAEFFLDRYVMYSTETVMVMCLDAKCKLISCKSLFSGGLTSVDISTRKILDYALSVNAKRIIMAHNHPNASPSPSPHDIEATRHIYNALHYADILLDDHLIIGENNEYVSLAEIGKVPKLDEQKTINLT